MLSLVEEPIDEEWMKSKCLNFILRNLYSKVLVLVKVVPGSSRYLLLRAKAIEKKTFEDKRHKKITILSKFFKGVCLQSSKLFHSFYIEHCL